MNTLKQYQSDGSTELSVGEVYDTDTVVLKLTVEEAANGDYSPEFEIQEVGTSFTDTATHTGSDVAYNGSSLTVDVTANSLSQGEYHWQSRVCDASDSSDCTEWVSFGTNAESATDFEILLNTAPSVPTSLGPTAHVDGSWIADTTPELSFNISDPDDSDQVKYQIEIDDSSDFSSPVVDYTSDFAVEGDNRTFTVGQAQGSGSYTTGSEAKHYLVGVTIGRVMATDDDSAGSSYTTANSGDIAFKVDATAPTIPSSVSPSTTPVSNSTPTWSWTGSTDGGIGLSATPYTVQWCMDDSFPASCDPNTSTASTTSFTHPSDLADGTWYLRVKAMDDAGNESSYSTHNSVLIDTTAPTVPSDLAPDTNPTANNTPTWSWTASTDSGTSLASTPYTVQWCSSDSFTDCGSNTATSSTTSYTHTTALADGTWYFRVKAVDVVSNESAYSFSNSVVIDTASPNNFEIKEPDSKSYTSDERPEFSWTVDSSASTYKIEVGNGDDDFEISGISASGSGKEKTNKYKLEYKDDKNLF